jgi:ABC-type nitrate/sulfonate/bicarbonate transport system substrate-binding protein
VPERGDHRPEGQGGIENISDLKWKKIGLPKKTICEFFLGRFLNLHSMSLHDVALMDLPASQSVDAVDKW